MLIVMYSFPQGLEMSGKLFTWKMLSLHTLVFYCSDGENEIYYYVKLTGVYVKL